MTVVGAAAAVVVGAVLDDVLVAVVVDVVVCLPDAAVRPEPLSPPLENTTTAVTASTTTPAITAPAIRSRCRCRDRRRRSPTSAITTRVPALRTVTGRVRGARRRYRA